MMQQHEHLIINGATSVYPEFPTPLSPSTLDRRLITLALEGRRVLGFKRVPKLGKRGEVLDWQWDIKLMAIA